MSKSTLRKEQKAVGHIGNRRDDCYWEPIYSPLHEVQLEPYDWDFTRDSGPCNRFVSGPTLEGKTEPGKTFKTEKMTFKNCDFQGEFAPGSLLMFDECHFIGCDFAYSNWKSAHFRKCVFDGSSISLAQFENCEFRDCAWRKMGFGSKTEFRNSFVNNPRQLIKASVSQTMPEDKSYRHRFHQWYRLQGTRAHILRNMMISHQSTGDEHTYFEVVKLHELQCAYARMTEKIYDIGFSDGRRIGGLIGVVFHLLDYLLLRCLGLLNNWGVSVSRPCVALAGCFLFFGTLYERLEFDSPVDRPFQKSSDITLLVGYGNQQTTDQGLSMIQNIHVLVAIVIYTVLFATVVSKLSRSR